MRSNLQIRSANTFDLSVHSFILVAKYNVNKFGKKTILIYLSIYIDSDLNDTKDNIINTTI